MNNKIKKLQDENTVLIEMYSDALNFMMQKNIFQEYAQYVLDKILFL